MLSRVLNSIIALAVIAQSAHASHVRTLDFSAPRQSQKSIREGDAIFTPTGSRILLDQQQGIVFTKEAGSVFVAICRHEKGGSQTVLMTRVPRGLYQISIRKLTHPESFFKFVGANWQSAANPSDKVSLSVVGTKFTVRAMGDGLRVGVDDGKVLGRSGSAEDNATVGKGMDLMPGQPPRVYQIDYVLGVKNLKVRQELGQNIVTGELAAGNLVLGAVMNGDRFTLKTDQSFIEVQNANGVGRIIWLPVGARPFLGS
jgi:hypothetical protein